MIHLRPVSVLLAFRFLFSTSRPLFHHYLHPHILQIFQSKPQNYEQCIKKMNFVTQMYQSKYPNIQTQSTKSKQQQPQDSIRQQLSAKLNMVYRVYTLPEVLTHYMQDLYTMVLNGKIANQSDLDRITSILTKKVKMDKNFSLIDLLNNLNNSDERQNFERELRQIKESDAYIDISSLSKKLREKYITIDSKQIYGKLREAKEGKNSIPSDDKQKQKQDQKFWDKLFNIKPRLLPEECNDAKIYEEHLKITNNKLRFRFPPEPNGYLHIGHIKSIRINFQTAKKYGGLCFLRYDDTNPETQSHQYIENILKNIRWLGYEPDFITYASDYFPQMQQFAIKLIKEGHAYVCDSTQIEIENERKQKKQNTFRSRPVEQSLKMFPNLREGQTLRLKLDFKAKNPTLRDPIIYRLKQHFHPRTGNRYKIYPMYDFAHCICDSLEHIDYSLCSLEFQVRRELYYKILDLLKLYKPSVWQYSRLNVEGSVISKRKIKALIQSHSIENWSDARLLTIGGLINRGYTAKMLLNFIDKVNASRAGNQNIVQYSLLQKQMRKQLYKEAQKSMMVLKPLEVQIENYDEMEVKQVQVDVSTKASQSQKRKVKVRKILYIEDSQTIIKQNSTIILKYLGGFEVSSCRFEESGKRIKIRKIPYEIKELKNKKEDYKILHWISQQDSKQIKVILFDKLLDENNKVNQLSKQIYQRCLLPISVYQQSNNTSKYWQMERLGYFKFDIYHNFIRCATLS